jgi:hypothetical protein
MLRLYEPDLGAEPDSPFTRDASNKLVRPSYWLDMNDRSLVPGKSCAISGGTIGDVLEAKCEKK